MAGAGVTRRESAIRVLVVEDDPGDVRLIALMLEEDAETPFVLTSAGRLSDALDLVGAATFDVILTDLGLPDSAGTDTVDALLRAWPDTPLVVLTGLADRTTGTRAVQRGCQDYLVKGFADAQLLQRTIRNAIERSAAARALKESERHHRLASVVFETSDEAMMVTDAANRIIAVNPAFERVTGYGAGEIVGHNPHYLASGRHDRAFYAAMWQSLRTTGHWRGEVWNRRKNGEIYVQRLTLSLIRGDDGRVVNHVGVFSDITDEKQEAERIRYRASYDALTGLPNRSLLYDRLLQALAKTARERGRLGVLFLDLDGFKPVNDRFGHLAGDHLLIALSERLQACVRESDTVARLGGDEFIVLLPDIGSSADAQVVARKILVSLAVPFSLGSNGSYAQVGTSIGIALYPIHGRTADELLSAADRAMYAAKQAGKGCYRMCAAEVVGRDLVKVG